MQVSGAISVKSFQDVASSQKISTLGTKAVSGYGASVHEKKRQKARIRYKKIKGSDRLIAPCGLPEEYYYAEQQSGVLGCIKRYLNLIKDKPALTENTNFFLSGVAEDEDVMSGKYFACSYLITELEAPVPYVGEGTLAVQGVVEKCVLDEEALGRIILYASQIAPEDTSSKFFYKLGFRYADEDLNNIVRHAIDKNLPSFEIPAGYMYLPKENIPKLLRYGHLF